ncbi:MAG: hypothetical protein ACPIOQ_41330, partial [Promethearchaeia archaeon]
MAAVWAVQEAADAAGMGQRDAASDGFLTQSLALSTATLQDRRRSILVENNATCVRAANVPDA